MSNSLFKKNDATTNGIILLNKAIKRNESCIQWHVMEAARKVQNELTQNLSVTHPGKVPLLAKITADLLNKFGRMSKEENEEKQIKLISELKGQLAAYKEVAQCFKDGESDLRYLGIAMLALAARILTVVVTVGAAPVVVAAGVVVSTVCTMSGFSFFKKADEKKGMPKVMDKFAEAMDIEMPRKLVGQGMSV